MWLRWLVVVGWIGGAVAAGLFLPPLTTHSGGVGDITSPDNPAILAEENAAKAFGFPVLSRVILVQHDPAGLPDATVEKAYRAARALHDRGPKGGVVAALPVLNAERVVPGSTKTGTTLVTYLYVDTGNFRAATEAAERYAATNFDARADRVIGVTGTVPARYEQTKIVNSSAAGARDRVGARGRRHRRARVPFARRTAADDRDRGDLLRARRPRRGARRGSASG